MPEYKYRALNASGEEVTGTLDAVDKKSAISDLRSRGLFPTRVQSLSGDEPSSRPKISEQQLMMILDAQPKTWNIFTIFKNYLRKKIILNMLDKQRKDKE
jgi:hypothetical protein